VFGSGYISNADFVVKGPTATLDVELANYPSFTAVASLYSNINYGVLIWQVPITSGSIHLLLKRDQFFSSSFNGIETDTYGNVTLRQQMNTSYTSASLSGTFFLFAVPPNAPGGSGQIGSENSNVITITKH
jgi:hypothetical protein